MFKRFFFIMAACVSLVSLNACAQEPECQIDNPALQAMPGVSIDFTRADGSIFTVAGKLADNDATRAAGFQRVCGATVDAMPILFEFQRELLPRFHMNNVVVPLDVAFIDKNGRIESLQLMEIYADGAERKPTYGADRPVMAVFEAHKGFFKKHSIDLKTRVSWQRDPVDVKQMQVPAARE